MRLKVLKVIGILSAFGLAVMASVAQTPAPKVGPARGTVFAVGGGAVPEVLQIFAFSPGCCQGRQWEPIFALKATILFLTSLRIGVS